MSTAAAAAVGLAALQSKTGSGKGAGSNKPSVPVMVRVDEEKGTIIFEIDARMAYDAIKTSATEKALPFVTLLPKWADGRTGNVVPDVVVVEDYTDTDGSLQQREAVFGLRLGAFNGFVTARRAS